MVAYFTASDWGVVMNESEGDGMTTEIITRLQIATTDAQRTWMITDALLQSLPVELSTAVKIAAIPHWFNADILSALLTVDAGDALSIYQRIQQLSFCERFRDLDHTLHDMTRAVMLAYLMVDQPERFKQLSQNAFEYFRQFDDPECAVEASWHLRNVNMEAGVALRGTLYNCYQAACNHSAVNVLHRHGDELRAVMVAASQIDAMQRGMRWNPDTALSDIAEHCAACC